MAQLQAKKFTLYYFPTSFSSQKVLFALYEKDLNFKPKLVSLFSGQHNQPWYVKMNPDGDHVPVLKHGDHIVVEPSQIIDYISKYAEGAGHPLVPDLNSELGRNVAELRGKLDSIPVHSLTYGVIFHPNLSDSGCQIHSAVQRSMKENFTRRLSLLTELAAKYPDLRDGYLSKSETAAHCYDAITDEAQLKQQLDDIQTLFVTVEAQLKKIKDEGSDILDEMWLFGPMFTAADISLSVLLSRLTLLGLDGRYFPPDRCPCIRQYYSQVQKRPAFQAIQKQIANLQLILIWENVKTAAPFVIGAVGVGALVAAGYLVYKKYR